MKRLVVKCMGGCHEEPLFLKGKPVCVATNPGHPNFSGHSRGRKVHLAKDDKLIVCNMLIDLYVPNSDKNWQPNA
jgi:hypothetical protein